MGLELVQRKELPFPHALNIINRGELLLHF